MRTKLNAKKNHILYDEHLFARDSPDGEQIARRGRKCLRERHGRYPRNGTPQ